jgi:hypothetical protein
MTYKVVIGHSPSDLEKQVIALKNAGWKEQGGLTISYPEAIHVGVSHGVVTEYQANLLIYGQAMYLPEP